MHRATPSSSSAASSSSQKYRRHRPNRDQLLRSLQILGQLSAPLPPVLPPSPPASRSNSPAPSHKRKPDPDFEQSHSKKPRTNAVSETPRLHTSLPPSSSYPQVRPSPYTMRSDPSEDGEVREDPPAMRESTAALSLNVPVRRPRRGHKLPNSHWQDIQVKYHAWGRALKWSGDTRLWSTYPTKHKEYRPLTSPPHPSSPYHKFGHILARLELVDALVCFVYSKWGRDYQLRNCSRSNWNTVEQFLSWCREKWTLEDTADEREKAFLGLIYMIEAFIHARKFAYSAKGIHQEDDELCKQITRIAEDQWAKEFASKKKNEAAPSPNTPPMLPSPASIGPANSANSTPTNPSRETGTPNASSRPRNAPPTKEDDEPRKLKKDEYIPAEFSLPVNGPLLFGHRSESGGIAAARHCMMISQSMLSLPMMAKHFPRTFARMMYSSLSPTDEHEPDIEDEEGELFWPGQCVTGEGIGWVCTMGKAMIKEFGKNFGYLGLDGIIPKPGEEIPPYSGHTPTAEVATPAPGPSYASPTGAIQR